MHTHPFFRSLAMWHKALGNERRLFSLQLLLRHQKLTVDEYANLLHIRQPSASRHLHILLRAGVLKSVRRGQKVFFSLKSTMLAKKILRKVSKSQ